MKNECWSTWEIQKRKKMNETMNEQEKKFILIQFREEEDL
jgi:hypothetical protein